MDSLHARYSARASTQLLDALVGDPIPLDVIRQAGFPLTLESTDGAWAIVLRVYPGYSELVANDHAADWAVDFRRHPEGAVKAP